MKLKKLFTLIIATTLLAACSNTENKTADSIPAEQPSGPSTSCYRYATSSDTVLLNIVRDKDAVTGSLTYMLKEKDKNTGTITGVMKENFLIANYTFMSEGVQSTRPVVFKLEGDSFTEGYGDVLMNNKTVDVNAARTLEFGTMKLKQIDCE